MFCTISTVREEISEVYVHQNEQETTKKAPYLLSQHSMALQHVEYFCHSFPVW